MHYLCVCCFSIGTQLWSPFDVGHLSDSPELKDEADFNLKIPKTCSDDREVTAVWIWSSVMNLIEKHWNRPYEPIWTCGVIHYKGVL